MLDILQVISTKKKKTGKGWVAFNAVCCHHRGHRPDKRMRGGIISDGNNQTYHCFNCGFTAKLVIGKPVSGKVRQLLKWIGLEEDEINKWSLESLKHKGVMDLLPLAPIRKVKFNSINLPNGKTEIDENNPEHKKYVDFLNSRGYSVSDYDFYITPKDTGRNGNRIIMPLKYRTKTIGHISRYLDDKTPKYLKENQEGALFGYELQKPEYEVALVFEGVFDALAFNGCALLHDDISEHQALLLRSLNRKIIVVPDQDKTGLNLVDRALELGFHVSLPDWGKDCKDANDAMLKYGKLPTLLSILQNATNSKIIINMKRLKLDKRI